MEFTITFVQVFSLSVGIVAPVIFFLALLILSLGLIVARTEKWTKFDTLYWAFITATTVGYGDIRPLRKISKVLSVLIALIGMILTGIMVAIALNATSVAMEKHTEKSVIVKIKKATE